MITRTSRALFIISIIAFCIMIFSMCMNETSEPEVLPKDTLPEQTTAGIKKDIDFQDFAGSSKCQKCHADIYKDHIQTSHFSTSAQALKRNIKGSFKKGENIFTYNPDLYVAMEKRDTGLYQVVYYKGEEKIALQFGLTIGSGTKGQSFMRWQDNKLFQLPLTYYSIAGKWANSPGFPNKVQYERPITARCMECHTTYADIISPAEMEPEEFDRNRIILGVDCEKCHGSGAEHVKFYSENPNEKEGKYITNPSKLTRQQNLDLCALCHGGRLERKAPSFTYAVGDSLSVFFNTNSLNKTGRNYISVDVHGNQYGLMSASKCFLKSNTMTCNSCHDIHRNERGKTELFSTRCQTCHSGEHKKTPQLLTVPESAIKSNCIDCHMALEPSHSIVLNTSGMETPKAAAFRSHFISVYNNETKKFIDSLQGRRQR